jgi:poly(hydroxyalkanoate) granule-associated protein
MPAKSKVEDVKPPEKEDASQVLDAVRKVLMAAIGAVALAQDEIEDFINRLIERGEIAEKDGKKLLGEITAKRKKESSKAEEEINRHVESLLERMKIPTKADIDSLSEKIATLTKKIDELKKS